MRRNKVMPRDKPLEDLDFYKTDGPPPEPGIERLDIGVDPEYLVNILGWFVVGVLLCLYYQFIGGGPGFWYVFGGLAFVAYVERKGGL